MGQTAERLHWVDIAKGILIILVVYGHLDFFASFYADTHAYDFKSTTNFLFLPYYMPAFFILTGLCANYEAAVWPFVKRNLLTLIVPCVLIGCVVKKWLELFFNEGISYQNFFNVSYVSPQKMAWFLCALFFAKLLFYAVHHISLHTSRQKVSLIVGCSVLFLAGIVLYNESVANPLYYQHGMMALPFIAIGYLARPYRHLFEYRTAAVIGLVAIWYCYRHLYPYLNALPVVTLADSWLFLILSTAGSMLVFFLCVKMRQCNWLESAGRHSLVVYLIHQPVMVFLIKLSKMAGADAWSLLLRVAMAVVIVAVTTLVCVLVSKGIDRYFPLLKGKLPTSAKS